MGVTVKVAFAEIIWEQVLSVPFIITSYLLPLSVNETFVSVKVEPVSPPMGTPFFLHW